MGVTLGKAGMTNVVYTNAVWTMVLGSLGWLIFTFLFTHKMDKLNNVLSNGKKAMVPIISAGAMLAINNIHAERETLLVPLILVIYHILCLLFIQ